MRILAIETSGSVGDFAVMEEDRILGESLIKAAGRLVEEGVEVVGGVLERSSTRIGDLDGVAVSLGPGSFTGLRVGLAVAKGLCFGRELPLIGVPTLDAIAESLVHSEGYVVPVLDARRGEIYVSMYRSNGAAVTRQSDYLALEPDAVIEMIGQLGPEAKIVLTGDAIAKHGITFRSRLASNVEFAGSESWNARAAMVGRIGLRLLAAGKTLDLVDAEPLYIRASEAERKAGGMFRHASAGREDQKND